MAKRYTIKTSFTSTPEIQENLETVAERFNTPVAQIVRECIEGYLPTLVDTYKKKEQNQNPIAKLHLED